MGVKVKNGANVRTETDRCTREIVSHITVRTSTVWEGVLGVERGIGWKHALEVKFTSDTELECSRRLDKGVVPRNRVAQEERVVHVKSFRTSSHQHCKGRDTRGAVRSRADVRTMRGSFKIGERSYETQGHCATRGDNIHVGATGQTAHMSKVMMPSSTSVVLCLTSVPYCVPKNWLPTHRVAHACRRTFSKNKNRPEKAKTRLGLLEA